MDTRKLFFLLDLEQLERTHRYMWQQIKQILLPWLRKPASEHPKSIPEQHDLLKRNKEESDHFLDWQMDGGHEAITERLRNAYNMYRSGLDPEDDELDFMEFQSTSGFVIHMKDNPECAKESACIQDYLRDQVLHLGYRLAVSDRRIRKKENRNEIIDRHVLKPPMDKRCGEAVEQGYGTITIEVLSCSSHPCNLKFITTFYTGRNYRPAQPFGELMEHLIS